MPYQVRTEQVEPQPIAVVRFRARRDELSTVIPAACGEVWNFIRAAKLDRPGRHVAVYLDGEINIECGAEVAGPFAGNGRVVYSTTPSGKVVTTTHIGPYARLGEAAHGCSRMAGRQQPPGRSELGNLRPLDRRSHAVADRCVLSDRMIERPPQLATDWATESSEDTENAEGEPASACALLSVAAYDRALGQFRRVAIAVL